MTAKYINSLLIYFNGCPLNQWDLRLQHHYLFWVMDTLINCGLGNIWLVFRG